MCFDVDASPPIQPLTGGSVEHRDLVLTADDGTEFAAFEALSGGDVGVIVLPDVRGLFRFYEELALRLAEHGADAIAIDYFGRTAGAAKRDADWDFWPEVQATTIAGLTADVRAAADRLRQDDPARAVFIIGFCFGGSNAWYMAASDLELSGVVGFYGHPDRADLPKGAPTVLSLVPEFHCPILALQAGDDPGIPVTLADAFTDVLDSTGQRGEVVVYDKAPHSFFDRGQEQFAEESADAWSRIQRFIADNT